MTSLADEAWFQDRELKHLLTLLNAEGGEARVAGGAVRNALMGLPVADVDIATTLRPEDVIERAVKAGIKAVPTGIEHGTVTLVTKHNAFEVTTLRRDVETDGRHAKVAFGSDWQQDAERRDLTINALYAAVDGTVIDLVDGLPDIKTRTVRFIGDASQRIAEDYLRILRFFRFFAYYGSGRPDADGLRACARAKDKLSTLSAERIWSEVKKLLASPDPSRALLWMRQAGVLTAVLPESEKWGIDAIHDLVSAERLFGWAPDPMLRLAAIVPPDGGRLEALAKRLRLSNAEAARLQAWANFPAVSEDIADIAFRRFLYRYGKEGAITRLKLSLSASRGGGENDVAGMKRSIRFSTLLQQAEAYQRPTFPIGGGDIVAAGVPPGKKVGEILHLLEEFWIDRNFVPDRAALSSRLSELVRGSA